MKKNYDVIVIGTGTAGSSTAQACKKAGWTVAIVESRTYGGTCSQRGCDPKKVLVGAAEWMDWKERMTGKGLSGDTRIDWKELMAFKKTFTESIPENTEKKFKELGIDCYHGHAKFQSKTQIRIGEDVLTGKKIVIATGAQPVKLGLKGEELMIHSDDFLDLEEMPKKILFAGGGYISMEFAHLAARAGAEVEVIHGGERPLEQFDPDLVDLLVKRSQQVGMKIHLNTRVESIEKNGKTYTVTAEKDGAKQTFTGDLVVHGLGRAPALDIDPAKGNVDLGEKGGVHVNEYLQSVSNPDVYAAGDAAETSAPPLTPISSRDSDAVIRNLLHGNSTPIEYPVVPSVAFTVPKIGSVGLTEEEARKSTQKTKVTYREISDWFTFKRTNEQAAAFKLITDAEKGTVLGAHILGGNADDLINHFSTAIRLELTFEDMKKTIFAYPTAASDIGSMLNEVD
ncbi:dihydrolipoyl dehydrogenase family protein [Sporosarcina gallistercoris]|uniref:NAD(P)/FAD-dependent oxidoreductase n=1 Tax=Sporosarcina gallistercoris TaxID=2762245 RepID=A0ABR8PJ34_9BACL|nr:NAD(P)/FAD-dependent oxidoreductase [Sporosarcina gallistercoris]MBD7908175.1 NAD(P)/FAD-dependent oxidoreductase [Sporosarcina gallistercoris]